VVLGVRVTVMLFPLLALAAPAPPELRIAQEAGARRVEILSAGRLMVASPPEGLWSIACDAVLTYLVVWDSDLPPGRLLDHGFRTRGWTVVSPQNQHLDVWGAVVAPDTTVFWITAHFLNAAARFLELGVPIWQ
jgi:hypothetical protein